MTTTGKIESEYLGRINIVVVDCSGLQNCWYSSHYLMKRIKRRAKTVLECEQSQATFLLKGQTLDGRFVYFIEGSVNILKRCFEFHFALRYNENDVTVSSSKIDSFPSMFLSYENFCRYPKGRPYRQNER
ncbi:CLUMA_CG002701, isoform A [Clunio marinus]|uniref:CLUMA_CG002701, isoform A n=1 Tax=Clunio marinus TaxID=568069 RepID=A0A1J1HL85_9DIPT|nr:CLUMA_CG002701, isoform A [Clunio marinus]